VTAQPALERSGPVGVPQAPKDKQPGDKRRRTAAERLEVGGLLLAPLLIAALAGLLAFYHRSLDLENAVRQQSSALDWGDKLWPQMQQHIIISALSTALVIVVAVPLGVLLTRKVMRRVAPGALTVANIGQALPAFGLLIVGVTFMGLGRDTVIVMLAIYALLPVLRNTMVGLDAVDRNVIEAGRGMGLTRMQVLLKIELPLAVPVIVAGIRTAMIINIGMATLAYAIGGGALGVTISSGLKNQQDPVLIIGSGLVAVVALSFDWLGAVSERYLKPRGI